jgi:hypothetical protein
LLSIGLLQASDPTAQEITNYVDSRDISLDTSKEYKMIKKAVERNKASQFFVLICAIRKAENGRAGLEFGIMHPKANDYDSQAGWCAATVVKTWERYKEQGGSDKDIFKFIKYLGKRYAPNNAKNDKKHLNAHWYSNVTYWYRAYEVSPNLMKKINDDKQS